ncbi:MAG: cbb3-type cytochrome c oxidase subunit I [Gammaproteobacteria bacterium]
MYKSQQLALKYFAASLFVFGLLVVAGLLAAIYYVKFGFLLGVLDFSVAKMLHINALIISLLMGFLGAIYWFLPDELGQETVGIALAHLLFYVLCLAVGIVVVVYIFVQYGGSDQFAMWFINQGRKYVEAPRWASIGIFVVLCTLAYNIAATALRARKITGVIGVLIAAMVPLTLVYLFAFPAITNMSVDLYWWWWLVHMWVEATWEIIIGCILALSLMKLLDTPRRIVEIWLYLEVGLVLGTGILGLGHHYFWIGTPAYWLSIGGVFSALEPLPLLGMVVHAIYDAGKHQMKTTNKPAFYWLLAEAFGNFIGAGVWGFMMTLPQINLFSHGTQWTVSHGHFAFYGAYVTGILAVVYIAVQNWRQIGEVTGNAWKWAFAFLNLGMIGMVGGLLISGMAQSFYERALGGSTLEAFMAGQSNPWFMQGMYARLGFGIMFAVGFVILVYDLGRMVRKGRALPPRNVAA